MSSPTKALARLVLFSSVMLLAACGYSFGPDTGSVLSPASPGALPTIKFKSVESPTLHPWLPYVIRSELRDEMAARGVAQWVDSGRADYEIAVKVDQFTFRSWITDREDETMLFNADMHLEAVIYDGNTNQEIWRSGIVQYNQSYEQLQERTAAGDLVREITRRLLTRMRRVF